MSYLVLARKYRPQTFADVVGQEHVTRTLANAFRQDRVHHAFLLCGPRGVGKTTLARILGKALNCENGPTAEPCNQCTACTTITNGTAVDYFEMDGASNRGIDAVRELTDAVRYQPAALRKKVYVIDEVHMLTTEAFNALLKTLEEPPEHVTFVLATTEPHKVPNTVLSRCQRYDFKLVPAARLARHLESIFAAEALDIEAGAIGLIVRESGGSVRDALSLSDQIISYVGAATITEAGVAEVLGVADRALTRTLVNALATGAAGDAMTAVEAAVERGVDEVQITRAICRYLRDLATVQVSAEAGIEGSEEERADLAAQAREIEPRRVLQMFDRMVRASVDMARIPQPRLVLDLALIDVASLEPLVPLGDLLQRLGALEQALGGSGPRGGAGPARGNPRTSGSTRAPATSTRPDRSAAATAAPEATFARTAPDRSGPASSARGSERVPPPEPEPPADFDSAFELGAPPNLDPPSSFGPPPDLGRPPEPTPTTSAGRRVSSPRAVVASVSAGEDVERWESVIAALGEEPRHLPLVRIYELATVLSWNEGRIEIGYPADSLDAENAIDEGRLRVVREFLASYLGRPVDLAVRILAEGQLSHQPGEARTVVDLNRQRAEEEQSRRETEAREHPVTRMVMKTFGATIKEIKTDV